MLTPGTVKLVLPPGRAGESPNGLAGKSHMFATQQRSNAVILSADPLHRHEGPMSFV
jgi:hypothetical protein